MNRVDALKELAFELNVHVRLKSYVRTTRRSDVWFCSFFHSQENIQFVINATYGELVRWLGKASIGVSSMIDEHFGINVVEFMVSFFLSFSAFSSSHRIRSR